MENITGKLGIGFFANSIHDIVRFEIEGFFLSNGGRESSLAKKVSCDDSPVKQLPSIYGGCCNLWHFWHFGAGCILYVL